MSGRWLSGRTREAYLFLFIPLPSFFPLSLCPLLFYYFVTFPLPPCQFGRFFKGKGNKKIEEMDQAGILRKFIQGVKAMSEGNDERGEDNFGSDFMVGQN